MELLWGVLIAFGIIYGCFCTNKKIVIILYGIILLSVNLELIIINQVIVNRYIDISVSILVFLAIIFSYWIRYSNNKWLDKVFYKITCIIYKLFIDR
jgi:hypothetical protein